jgi:polar amino acid transport system permease protein
MRISRFLPLIAILALTGCSSSGNWGWYVIDPSTSQGLINIKFLLSGFGATIVLSVVAATLSMIIGLIVVLPGMSENRWVRLPSRVYVEVVRSVPLLPMLFWVFYGMPVVLKSIGIDISIASRAASLRL